ncbi:hypothetical protein [Corynebacterium aquilae]|nr:hypothetical protein [Corynebacterium aquilae]
MDLSVVKTVFGDFSTFVSAIVDLVANFPAAVTQLGKLSALSSK